jgi:plasmid stabilization system protein ParE
VAYLAFTRRAVRDLEEIERYSVETWGDRVANEYLTSIEQALRRLQENPNLLRSKPNFSEHFSFYRAREHFLICTFLEQNIYVLAIRHGGMDLPHRVAELEPLLLDEAAILHRAFLKSRDR